MVWRRWNQESQNGFMCHIQFLEFYLHIWLSCGLDWPVIEKSADMASHPESGMTPYPQL